MKYLKASLLIIAFSLYFVVPEEISDKTVKKITRSIKKSHELKKEKTEGLKKQLKKRLKACENNEEKSFAAEAALQALKKGANVEEAVKEAAGAQNKLKKAFKKCDNQQEKTMVAKAAHSAAKKGVPIAESITIASEGHKAYQETVKYGEPKKDVKRAIVFAAAKTARELVRGISKKQDTQDTDKESAMAMQKKIKKEFRKNYTLQQKRVKQARNQNGFNKMNGKAREARMKSMFMDGTGAYDQGFEKSDDLPQEEIDKKKTTDDDEKRGR